MDISMKRNRNSIKVPNKKSMNLYQPDFKNNPKVIYGVGIAIILVLIAFLSKTFIVDGIQEIRNAKAEIAELQMQYDAYNAKIATYSELKEQYYRYSETYSKDEEQLVDRITIMNIIEEVTNTYGSVTSTSIQGNQVSIRVVTKSLDELSLLKQCLEQNDLVTDVIVYSAQRSTGDVVSSVAFTCKVMEG